MRRKSVASYGRKLTKSAATTVFALWKAKISPVLPIAVLWRCNTPALRAGFARRCVMAAQHALHNAPRHSTRPDCRSPLRTGARCPGETGRVNLRRGKTGLALSLVLSLVFWSLLAGQRKVSFYFGGSGRPTPGTSRRDWYHCPSPGTKPAGRGKSPYELPPAARDTALNCGNPSGQGGTTLGQDKQNLGQNGTKPVKSGTNQGQGGTTLP